MRLLTLPTKRGSGLGSSPIVVPGARRLQEPHDVRERLTTGVALGLALALVLVLAFPLLQFLAFAIQTLPHGLPFLHLAILNLWH